jgi:hypothetical protein
MVVVPAPVPLHNPVNESTVAIVLSWAAQLPVVEQESRVDAPAHKLPEPAILPGNANMVNTCVSEELPQVFVIV